MKAATGKPPDPDHVVRIRDQLGPCVLLKVPTGKKGPRIRGWQRLGQTDMTPEYLASLNHGQNIGVLLGAASEGLCSIDIDNDNQLEAFLRLNPGLRESLISRGSRGGNIWLRIKGGYLPAGKIKDRKGKPRGEWRADGNQTVIYGQHPSGCRYRDNGKRPLEIQFQEINWPEDFELPWEEKPEPTAPDLLRDCIILPSGPLGLYKSAERVFQILARSKAIFLRGGRVFQPVLSETGLLRLEVVSEQTFRSLIERHGKVVAYRGGSRGEELIKADARCSLDTSAAWLASDAKDILLPIAAVHSCPIIIETGNGIEVLVKGYHSTCGGRLLAGGTMPEQMGVAAAVEILLDSVAEYDFTTPADKSRAIAAILTPALKFGGLLEAHTPLFVVEADESQAGKGFFLEQVQTIYREPASMVTQRNGGVGSFDESLGQALIDGRPFIQLDNIRGRIGSPYFEAILTCPLGGTFPARVPYKGQVQVRPGDFVFQLTSNGFESTRDLANRSCIIRIRKRRGFSFRRYPQGGLLAHIAANQPRYLGAVYSVISQWVAHGKRSTDDMRGEGRFRRWAQVLSWIIENLFGLPPLMEGHEAAQERVSNSALNWLRQVCLASETDARLDEELTASGILEICQGHSLDIPGLANDAPDEKVALLRIGGIMKKTFKENESVEVDGFEIHKSEDVRYSDERRREVTINKYVIQRSASNAPKCA